MIWWHWWLSVLADWLDILEATGTPKPAPPEPPHGGGCVINLEHWRRTHPHRGRAA